jgi:hypothetical protein
MTDQPVEDDHSARIMALEKELADSRAQSDSRLVQAQLKTEAIRAGIIDLDILKLLDVTDLKLNSDGTVPEAAAALTRLKRDKPWGFSKPSTSNPAVPPTAEPPNARTAMEMTHKEWRHAREQLIRRP